MIIIINNSNNNNNDNNNYNYKGMTPSCATHDNLQGNLLLSSLQQQQQQQQQQQYYVVRVFECVLRPDILVSTITTAVREALGINNNNNNNNKSNNNNNKEEDDTHLVITPSPRSLLQQ